LSFYFGTNYDLNNLYLKIGKINSVKNNSCISGKLIKIIDKEKS
jgi:hypothetical protein